MEHETKSTEQGARNREQRWVVKTMVHIMAMILIGFGTTICCHTLLFAASAPTKIVVTYGGLNERSGVLFVAKDAGAEVGYGMMKVLYDRRIYANVDGLRNVIRILGRNNEQIRKLRVEDIIDERVASKLEKEGLF